MIAFTTPYITKRAIVCFHPAFIIVDWAYPTCRITLDKDGLKAASFHPRCIGKICVSSYEKLECLCIRLKRNTRGRNVHARKGQDFSLSFPLHVTFYIPRHVLYFCILLLSLSLSLLNSFVSPPPRCHNKPLVYSESSLSTILTFCSLSSVSTIYLIDLSLSLLPCVLRFLLCTRDYIRCVLSRVNLGFISRWSSKVVFKIFVVPFDDGWIVRRIKEESFRLSLDIFLSEFHMKLCFVAFVCTV